MTARDDARGRHPAFFRRPTHPPAGGAAEPRPGHIATASIITLFLLAWVAPPWLVVLAVWVLAAFGVVAVWIGVCELVRAWRWWRWWRW